MKASSPSMVLVAQVILTAVSAGCMRFADIRSETRPTAPNSTLGAEVSTEACTFSLFHVAPFGKHPLVKAHASLGEKVGDVALVDVVIEEDYIWAVVGDVRCVTLRGRPALSAGPEPHSKPAARVEPKVQPRPVRPPTIVGDPVAAAKGPRQARFDQGSDPTAAVDVLRTWVGSNVVLKFRTGQEVAGRLTSVADDKVVLSAPDGQSLPVPVSLIVEATLQ